MRNAYRWLEGSRLEVDCTFHEDDSRKYEETLAGDGQTTSQNKVEGERKNKDFYEREFSKRKIKNQLRV